MICHLPGSGQVSQDGNRFGQRKISILQKKLDKAIEQIELQRNVFRQNTLSAKINTLSNA